MSSLPSGDRATIDRFITDHLSVLNLPGVALAVTDATGLLYERGYGVADLGTGAPVTAETRFEIGSISKSFAAVLLAQDALAGRVDLHAPITRYLPWFSVQAQHDRPITPHHLLQHSSGIVTGSEASTEARSEVWALRDTPAIAEPGTWFHYSNVGYKALGLVLEERHGLPYSELLQARILGPLGLERTAPAITSELRHTLATGYEALLDDRPLPPSGQLAAATWLEADTADGSIIATAADLAAYLREWITPGDVVTPDVLSTVTADPIVSDHADPGTRYGYGWDVFTRDAHRHLAHGGGMVGYRSYVIVDLDAQLGVAVLANGPGDTDALARGVLEVVRAGIGGRPMSPPELDDPTVVTKAAEIAGRYRSHDAELVLCAHGDRLATDAGCPLVRAGDDTFHLLDGVHDRFLLGLEREQGEIRAVTYGSRRLTRDGVERSAADGGADRELLAGHWRAHNPWFPNFRTVLRDGQPLLIAPTGVESPADEEPLVALGDDMYRVGADPRSPERLTYAMVLDATFQQATLSGAPYHRTFTQ